MPLFPVFVLRFLKAAPRTAEGRGRMTIIIRVPYSALEEELRSAFQGQEDVQVIVDRRAGERRTRRHPVAVERRLAERRRAVDELVEVVIST